MVSSPSHAYVSPPNLSQSTGHIVGSAFCFRLFLDHLASTFVPCSGVRFYCGQSFVLHSGIYFLFVLGCAQSLDFHLRVFHFFWSWGVKTRIFSFALEPVQIRKSGFLAPATCRAAMFGTHRKKLRVSGFSASLAMSTGSMRSKWLMLRKDRISLAHSRNPGVVPSNLVGAGSLS